MLNGETFKICENCSLISSLVESKLFSRLMDHDTILQELRKNILTLQLDKNWMQNIEVDIISKNNIIKRNT